MGLPEGLLSTYQQYKHDTDVVASWLATTAKTRGYPAAFSQTGPTPGGTPVQTSMRLKGKARKEAKQAAQAAAAQQAAAQQAPASATQSATPKASKPKHVLAIRDFVPLATFIAGISKPPPLELPVDFTAALDRVIQARKRFSATLKRLNKDTRADKSHAYFVLVLEKVHETLKPLPKTEPLADGAAYRPLKVYNVSAPKSLKFNAFEGLNVYEPSQEFLDAPDVVVPPRTEYTAEEEEDSADRCFFVFTGLLMDFFKLREQINNLWADYARGAIDLAAASVGVNTALQIARSMEEEVAPILKKHGGSLELIPEFFMGVCDAMGLDPTAKQWPNDDLNFQCHDIASEFLLNAVKLLNAYKEALPPGVPPVYYSGIFGYYDSERSPSNNRDRYAQDKAAMLEFFSDATVLAGALKTCPVVDELTRGIHYMRDTQEIPLWLCFAAQTYLDTLHVFGPNIDRCLKDFRAVNSNIEKSIDRARAVDVERGEKDHHGLEKEMNQLHEQATFWTASGEKVLSALRQASGDGSAKKSNFLRHSPLFCGLYTHHMRSSFHRVGIAFAAKPGIVMHAVQLYQAAKQEGFLLDKTWKDIEVLLEMQGNSTFFVGDPPTSMEAYFKNFGMSKGASASNWVPTARKTTKPKVSKAGLRQMKFKGWASLMFNQRIHRNYDQRTITAETVEGVLEKSGWFKEDSDAGADAKGKDKAKNVRKALTPAELIQQVSLAIQQELPEITFDYFLMDDVCWKLLHDVRDAVDSDRGGSIPNKWMPANARLSEITGVVFIAGVGKIETTPGTSNISPLLEAGQAIQGILTIEPERSRVVCDAMEAVLAVEARQ